MSDLQKAAEMALEALESWKKTCLDCGRASDELGRATAPIQALRQALGQPEREWVGLTEDEIEHMVSFYRKEGVAYAAEAKLKEKNT